MNMCSQGRCSFFAIGFTTGVMYMLVVAAITGEEKDMSDEIIIDISTSGKTTGLHMDEFPLGFLGDLSIGRASEIFFNKDKQNWEVILPEDTHAVEPAKGFTSYNGARKFEVDWLQACMKANVQPSGQKGIEIAKELREIAK